MKIYTKRGDKGTTFLVSGRNVSKTHSLLEAYGTIDELNAFIGLCMSKINNKTILEELLFVQNRLFNIGSLLAKDNAEISNYPSINQGDITFLENSIDKHSLSLDPLKSFILPSGSEAISLCHVCRTIARRAERRIVEINDQADRIPVILAFINRLSDYFFILARIFARLDQVPEQKWIPGNS